MPRQKRVNKQERFDLYPDDPDERRLHEYLRQLAKQGRQREWIVLALLIAMKNEGR